MEALGAFDVFQDYPDHPRISIVGILHQFEDGESGRADELVAEELEDARPRPERQVQRFADGIHSGPLTTHPETLASREGDGSS